MKGLVDLLTVAFLTRFDTWPANFLAPIGAVSAGAGVVVGSYMTFLRLNGVRPIGDRPLLLLGVLLIVVGLKSLAVELLAELVVRVQPGCDAPRLIARVVTGESSPGGGLGHSGPFSGRGP